jgi:hypothetical protein
LPSGTHTPAMPRRPGYASSRDPRAMRERQRERQADITEAVYVVAYDPRHAVVRNQDSTVEYVVDNPSGFSFSPDSIVKVGTYSGHEHGRFIIAGTPPTPGRSAAPTSRAVRIAGFSSPEPEAPLIGRPYVGIGGDATTLLAHKYLGGVYDSDLGESVDISAMAGSIQYFALMSLDPLLFVVVTNDGSGKMYIANFTAGTLSAPISQPTTPGSTNRRPAYSGAVGGSGSVYWSRQWSDGDGFFKLWRLDADGTHTAITPDGDEPAPGFDDGVISQSTFVFGDETAFAIAYGSPPGRVVMSDEASAFVGSADWLPFDVDTSEWANWDGAGVCENGDALILVPFGTSSVSASGLGRVTPAGLFTQLYTQAELGVACSSADPSPDGVSAVVWATSPDQIARVRLDGTTEPEWEAVEDMPEGGTPGQFWCLD